MYTLGLAALAGGGLLAAAVPAGIAAQPAQATSAPGVLFTIADAQIAESSGLAVSRRHSGVFYTHNDSEDDARVFALDSDGRTQAVLTLKGAKARDWEGIASGEDDKGRAALFIGDIGDNLGGAWPEIWVYRITEPSRLEDRSVPFVKYRFRYADGPRDAEALLVDPRSNRIYIVSKGARGGTIYVAPKTLSTTKVNVLAKVTEAPPMVTDGAFSPDGERLVLRDYLFAHVYEKPGSRLARLTLPVQSQGESITYTSDGRSLLSGSEGPNAKVWTVPLPRVALTAAQRANPSLGRPELPDTSDSDALVFGGNLLALLFAAGSGYVLLLAVKNRQRRPPKQVG